LTPTTPRYFSTLDADNKSEFFSTLDADEERRWKPTGRPRASRRLTPAD
jgi:hypothetical protein